MIHCQRLRRSQWRLKLCEASNPKDNSIRNFTELKRQLHLCFKEDVTKLYFVCIYDLRGEENSTLVNSAIVLSHFAS